MSPELEELCGQAVRLRGSAIHIDPRGDALGAVLRIDGSLVPSNATLPAATGERLAALTQRGSNLAALDCAGVRWRVSAISALDGLHFCLHRPLAGSPTWTDLGLTAAQAERLERLLTGPPGLVLFAGPPRSGKTSTLHSTLRWLDPTRRRIVTVEDPIEHAIPGTVQTARPASYVDPTEIAASLAEQDPDVIGIGEVVDTNTAVLATDCATSGVSVLGTFRSSDGSATVGRLYALSVEPFVLVSALRAAVGQRLLPLCCPHCLAPDLAGAASLAAQGLASTSIEPKMGTGCGRCSGRGVLGAIGVFEVFELTASVQQMILEGGSRAELAGEARKGGMVTLRERALELVAEGRVRARDALLVGDV